MKCGSSLAAVCPECGIQLPAEAQFCFSCGHRLDEAGAEAGPEPEPVQDRLKQYIPEELLAKLESARASGGMQGERRVVTMLFCDVQGSTAAAENLDPEEWAEIINGAFDYLISPVYRYEGTLARLMGDAILAFFGAPIAHEDDPQRAVLAGLDIVNDIGPYAEQVRRQWGIDFAVRVGINTGLVVVGEVGSDLRVEYTALGDAINLASRMEQTAQPGTVQISADTHKLVAPLFEFEDLGGVEVKGKSEPVNAYRAIRRKEVPGTLRGIEGLEAPLIGRDREMATLKGMLHDLSQGRGQIASVMGEAGLGKSRLMAELRQAAADEGLLYAGGDSGGAADNGDGPGIGWYEGRSLSFQTSTPYALFVDLLGGYFGLRPDDGDADKAAKLSARVGQVSSQRVPEIAPFLATMLGIDVTGDDAERVRYLEPPQLRARVFGATQELVEMAASKRPMVLVFEDLHWTDSTSLDLIEQLMPLTDRTALMIVALFRPSRQEPSWRFHEVASRDYPHRYTSVSLEPLGEDSSRELVANLLHVEDLPERVRALILSKAEGNPFFVEEVIRSLLDAKLVVRENSRWRATREIENIALPDTLAGVITARLDRLDEESKRVAQTSAVIGREFPFDTLRDVHDSTGILDDSLVDLQRRELVRERSVVPRRVYMFKHALTQEAAYGSLLLRRRRELHKRVAECLQEIEPDSAHEIAGHFVEAGEPVLALPYLVDAGDRAAGAYSTPEAIDLYSRALEILETVDDLPLARRAYEGLGGALTFAGDVQRAVENYHKMLHAAQELGNHSMQVSALNKLGYVTALMQGEFPDAEEHLVEAERLAKQCGDRSGLAEMHMTYCYLRTLSGDFDDATEHLSEAAQIGQDLELEEPRLFGLTHTANTLIYMSRFEEALEAAEEARRVAEEAGNSKYLSEIMALTLPFYYIRNGQLDAAESSAKEGVEMAARIGAPANEAEGSLTLGVIGWMRGDYQSAVQFHERALDAGRRSGMPYLTASALCALGMAYLDISQDFAPRVTELHSEALEVLKMPLGTATGAMSWADLGFCAMALGNLEGADETFRKGLTSPSAPMYIMRPRLLVGCAFVALARGELDEATRCVTEARELSAASDMRQFYPMVAFAEAQVAVASGDQQHALERFTQAEALAEEMDMRPLVWQARAGAAGVLTAAGRAEAAEEKLAGARAMIDEIASLFDDDDLRAKYLEGTEAKLAF